MLSRMAPSFDDVLRAYRGRRVLVTGASGFLGCWVARLLHEGGAELFLGGRSTEALRSAGAAFRFTGEMLCADFGEPGTFAQLYRDVRPVITFHLAGYGVDPEERDAALAERLNHHLIEEIANVIGADPAAGWPGLRLIHAGSAAEYGAVAGPVTEVSPENPVNLYGRTKLAGKWALRRAVEHSGLRATTARLFTVYGPGEHAHRLLPSLIAAAQSGRTLALTAGEQQRDFTYVADVAEGLLRLGCLGGAAAAVVNMATGTLTRVRTFAETAAAALGVAPGKLDFGALPYRADETPHGPVSTALLEATLAWKPVTSIREGIEKTAAFAERAKNERARVGS